MIPSGIKPGDRARLCVHVDGSSYHYGTIADFDGQAVLLEMDSGAAILAPWWEIVGTDEAARRMPDPLERYLARQWEEFLSRRWSRQPR